MPELLDDIATLTPEAASVLATTGVTDADDEEAERRLNTSPSSALRRPATPRRPSWGCYARRRIARTDEAVAIIFDASDRQKLAVLRGAAVSRPVSLRTKAKILRDSVATLGVGGTMRRILVYYLTYRPGDDRSFDRRHGTDTSGLLMPPDWSFEDESLREQAVGYVPSPPRVTRAMLRALDVPPEPFTFADIGCGKGRVLLVAAEHPFRRVVGVEASPALAAVARNNCERAKGLRLRCRDLRVDIGDAMTWELPPGDVVLHLYHPFGPDLLTRFLGRVRDALAREPRRLRLLYLREKPEVREVFLATPWLTRLRTVQCVDPLYSWAMFGAGDPR